MQALRFFGWFLGGVQCAPLFALHPLGWLVGATGAICGLLALRRPLRPEPRMLALFWPFLTAAAAILVGMRFPSPSGAGPAPTDLLELLWLAHVVGCAAVVAFARGFRLVAGAALSLGTFVFAGCSLVAAMSVTGTWL